MKKLWFTSDLHLNQKNIIKNISPWESRHSLRDFEDQNKMSWHIIDKINENVRVEDDLFILGDVYFGKNINLLQEYMEAINTRNKHLILGNHDWLIIKNFKESRKLFKSINNYLELNFKFPIPGTDFDKDKWEGRAHITLCHYAMRVWNRSHKGSWMLYGHSHSSLDDLNLRNNQESEYKINQYYTNTKTMDVGIDNAFKVLGEYRPFSFDEIYDIFEKRENLVIDHHDKKTED